MKSKVLGAILCAFALLRFGNAADAQTLFVSEYYNREVFQYDLNGNPVGNSPFASDTTRSRFNGMAFDKGGYLYVTDNNNSLSIFSPSGALIGHIALSGGVSDICFDAAGNLYAACYDSGIVYRVAPSEPPVIFARVPLAECLALDPYGNIYVSSFAPNGSIYKFKPDGTQLGVIIDIPYPEGMDCDTNGNLYVAPRLDYFGYPVVADEIRRFAPDGTRLISWTSPNLIDPLKVKFGPDSKLYITDAGGFIYRFSSSGVGETNDLITGLNIPSSISSTGKDIPIGIAFRPAASGPLTVSGTVTFEGIVPQAAAQNVTFEFRSFGNAVFPAQTFALKSGDSFTLNAVPGGNYALHIKADKYLATDIPINSSGGAISGVSAFLRAGDANNDNSVDSTDFGILIGAFNSEADILGSGYDSRADFNDDGFVDSTDFGLLIGNFNTVGDL